MTPSDSGGGHGSQGEPASAASIHLSRDEKEARVDIPPEAHETPAAAIDGRAKRRIRRVIRILIALELPRGRANLVSYLSSMEYVGRETIDDDLKMLVDGGYVTVADEVVEMTSSGRHYLDELRKRLKEVK